MKAIGILDGSGNSAVLTSGEISVGQANAPTFSVTAGTYEGKKTVEITAATGDAIHYTTDGSDPTVQSAVYDGAITVAETTTLKAIAVAQGRLFPPSPAHAIRSPTKSVTPDLQAESSSWSTATPITKPHRQMRRPSFGRPRAAVP